MNNLTTIIINANCTILMQTNYAYSNTAQKMKFSIKDFFSKCDQINDPVCLILFPSPSTISEAQFLFVNIIFFDKRSFFLFLFVVALFYQFWFFFSVYIGLIWVSLVSIIFFWSCYHFWFVRLTILAIFKLKQLAILLWISSLYHRTHNQQPLIS